MDFFPGAFKHYRVRLERDRFRPLDGVPSHATEGHAHEGARAVSVREGQRLVAALPFAFEHHGVRHAKRRLRGNLLAANSSKHEEKKKTKEEKKLTK